MKESSISSFGGLELLLEADRVDAIVSKYFWRGRWSSRWISHCCLHRYRVHRSLQASGRLCLGAFRFFGIYQKHIHTKICHCVSIGIATPSKQYYFPCRFGFEKSKGHADTVWVNTCVWVFRCAWLRVPALQASHYFPKASGRSPASLCMHKFVNRASWFPGFHYHFREPPGLSRLLHARCFVFACRFRSEGAAAPTVAERARSRCTCIVGSGHVLVELRWCRCRNKFTT